MGIDVNRTISFTFLIAGALAGAAGSSTRSTSRRVRFDQGFQLGLIAFTAAVLGGIGNLPGAVLGAILIGLIQAFNEGLNWHAPGSDWTRVDRLLDPDPDPRLPARGPARRADARGRMSERVESPPEAVGFRNQLRARWEALPIGSAAAIAIGLELLLAVAALLRRPLARLRASLIDRARSTGSAGCRRCPWQLAGAGGVVVIFVSWSPAPRSLAVVARDRVRASSGSRSATARWALPDVAIVARGRLPVLPAEHVHDPGVRRRGRTSRRASTCSSS